MTEPQEQTLISEAEIKNSQLQKLANAELERLLQYLPDLSAEQLDRAKLFALESAQVKLDAQSRIVELEREKAGLIEQSDRDPYNPNIYSYNGFLRTTKDDLAELRRNNQTAVIMAIDLDNFKPYNDAEGHAAGDVALGLAGGLMRSVLRPSDKVTRAHGDEYIVILFGAKLGGGVIAAERIRQAIAGMSVLLGTNNQFTASIGVALIPQNIIQAKYESDEEFKNAITEVYQLADEAHYKGAKNVGKNRIGVMLPDGTIETAMI